VTTQVAGRSLGWRIAYLDPSFSSLPSSGWTLDTVGSHAGHAATAANTRHTDGLGAAMAMEAWQVGMRCLTI
jgi:hypothetical protein